MSQNSIQGPPAPALDPDRFKIGTLTYTKLGLVSVFVWLLWGDVFVMMHALAISGGVLNLALKRHNAPNWMMGMILTSLPQLLNFTLNPIISTASDRTRTRWGRRIPYLALSAPVTGALMILLGFSEDMGYGISRLAHWAPDLTIILVIAICLGLYRVSDLFVGTVYYYLFNDVVPKAFLSRFSAMFQVVSVLTAALYSFFIFKYSENHMKEICIIAGIVYIIGYTVMCVFIKEGKYPPPPEGMGRRQGFIGLVKTYWKECFFHRFYWLFFLTNATWVAVSACGWAGLFLTNKSLGLSLGTLGSISSVTYIVTAVLLYPRGVLADRFHPLRFMRFSVVLQTIWGFVGLNWLFWNPSAGNVVIVFIGITAVSLPLSTMHRVASLPMCMHLMPQDRYGQFCAADAMVSALVSMIGGAVSGFFLDWMTWVTGHVLAGSFLLRMNWLYDNSDFAYRFISVWQLFFMFIAAVTLFLLHHEWVKLGGQHHFVAPPDPAKPDDLAEAEAQHLVAGGTIE